MQEPRSSDHAWPIRRLVLLVLLFASLTSVCTFFRLAKNPGRVVAYVAQDQVYAEPIFAEFEKRTGIRVRAVYDSEAVKTVGLANRLLAEKNHPQCDVFWGNEEMRTRQLAAQEVFRAPNGWAAFGHRSRRIVINTKLVRPEASPKSWLELTNQAWQGKIALAYPQFGTTATHFHALRQLLGPEAWENWCRALAENNPLVVDGNSVVVRMVGRGEASVGMTDSDDIAAGIEDGLPVGELPLMKETLLIPNTVAVMRNAPHPEAAQRLFAYLQSPAVAQRLVEAKALESATTNASEVQTLRVDWPKLLGNLEQTTATLNKIFLR
jgi:iron(III) transport system substrate-binding protein